MSASPLTIIDCGANRAALAIVSQSADRLRVDDLVIERLPGPVVGDHWLEQMTAALQVLGSRHRPAGRVVLVVPPHLTLLKMIRVPRVSAAKRAKVIRFEAAQGIPFPLADVVWGTAPVHEGPADLDLVLAAAKLEAVNALGAAATAAGLHPSLMLPAAMATLAASRQMMGDTVEPAVVLNVGARSTVLWQVAGNRSAGRTLGLGGDGVDSMEATVMLATRLTQEVTRSVLHFGRREAMPKPARVWLTGGAAMLAGLDEALSARLGLPVGRPDPAVALELGSVAGKAGREAVAPALTDIIGAAVSARQAPQKTINLLPPGLRRRAARHRRQPWLLAAIGLAAAALLPPILHLHQLNRVTRVKAVAIEAALTPVRERDARIRSLRQELAELRLQADALAQVQQRRSAWLGLLGDLQARLVQVEDVWFERWQTIPPAGDEPQKLAVSGRMLDQTNPLAKVSPETFNRVQTLLAGLVDSPYVAKVEGEHFDNSRPGILQFDFVLVTDPAHPL